MNDHGRTAAPEESGWVPSLLPLVDHPWFERAIIALIIFNAALLGLATDARVMAAWGGVIGAIDDFVLTVFVIEIALRILARGRAFFKSGWAWFDLVVVAISLAPAVDGLAVLRAFRVLRLLRLFSAIPKLRRVVGGFFAAIPGMAGVIGVLVVLFYVSAVIATTMFGGPHPADTTATAEEVAAVDALFGTLGRSLFTLFQLMTLENWADGVVLPVLKIYPDALWFFMPFIVITAFAVLNLFIGIIVDAMQDERAEERDAADADAAEARAERERGFEAVLGELQALRAEVAALRGARDP
ncbi:MAG: ion transporter [Pseudomonadota bacterium]